MDFMTINQEDNFMMANYDLSMFFSSTSSSSGNANLVAIDNKIEQAMVKLFFKTLFI